MTSIRGTKIISVSRQMVSYNPLPCVQTSVCSLNGGGGGETFSLNRGKNAHTEGPTLKKNSFRFLTPKRLCIFFKFLSKNAQNGTWHFLADFGWQNIPVRCSAVLKCWPRLPRGALRPGKCLPTAITPIRDKSLQRQVSGDNGWWTISFKKRLATDTPDNSLRRQTPHRTHYQKRQKRRIYAKECGRGGPAAGGHRQCETRGDGKSRGGEVGPPQQPSWASNSGPWENGKGRRPTRGWGWGCSPPFSDPVPPW